jgi:hypothetical protein
MITSIQLTNQWATSIPSTDAANKNAQVNSVFSGIYNEQLDNVEPVIETQYSHRISKIDPADVTAIYKALSLEVEEEREFLNVENKELQPFDYLNGNIEKIMDYPIEVKINRDEVYEAIVYSRLGINFLDVKEIEVRLDLLSRAKDDVIKARDIAIKDSGAKGGIPETQATALLDRIEGHQEKLVERKQQLLEGSKLNEDEKRFFDQLTRQRNFKL